MSDTIQLTKEQEAQIPAYVEHWKKEIGLCTAPIDKDRAFAAVKQAYACAGLKEPTGVIYCVSPMEGVKKAHELAGGDRNNSQLQDQVWQACYGSHDAYWLAYYAFCRDVLNIEVCNRLNGLFETAKECGWWWPFEDLVIISDRPSEIHFDAQDRAHNATGAAILYRDGFGVYCWHGLRVTRDVIVDPVTVERIEVERNAEIRRILVERYGETAYVRDSGAHLVHADDYGSLYRKDQSDDQPIYCVKVICPTTGREYFLGIDPSLYGGLAGRNARAAVASTWRKNDGTLAFTRPQDYAPVCET